MPLGFAGGPYSVALADLNGDGKPDLITGTASRLTVRLNTTP